MSDYDSDEDAQRRTEAYRTQLQHLQWERDPLLVILRGHLYIEIELNQLLRLRVLPEVLDSVRLTFERKVRLGERLGLIPKGLVPATLLLNDYRNRFAHELFVEIGDEEAKRLYETLEKSGAFKGSQMTRGDTPIVTISRCIRALHAIYGSSYFVVARGKRPKIGDFILGPFVTEEIPQEEYDEMRRTQYEEARRLERVFREHPEAVEGMIRDTKEAIKKRQRRVTDG